MSESLVTPVTAAATTPAEPSSDDDTLPSFVEAYNRFLPAANAIPAANVRRSRIALTLALLNAARGVEAVMARRADIATLAGISIDTIDTLPAMGQALLYASGRVSRLLPVTGEIKAMLATAHRLRADLLVKAQVLVIDGIVSAETIEGIRRGRGSVDTAGDCVALAALFHEHAAALAGHVTVAAADIQAANDIGAKLLAALHPAGAPHVPDKDLAAASETRDRLWTLFENTWEQHVWRAGAWLFGRDVELHVPLLGTRVHAATPAPTPAPTPATPTPVAASTPTPAH